MPILGYGEDNERIFCFSKIFTGGGLKYFFEEQRQEADRRQRKIKQMAERFKRQRAMPQPQLEPRDEVAAWLAGPKSTDDEASNSSDMYDEDSSSDDSRNEMDIDSNAEQMRRTDSVKHLIDKKHFMKGNLLNWEDRIALNAEDAKREYERMETEWKSLGSLDGQVTNPHILKDDWLNSIPIRKDDKAPSPKLIWDLNDPGMRFRVQERARGSDFTHAAATILPPKEKKLKVVGPAAGPEEIFQELAFYNISKDERYMKDMRNVVTSKNKVSDGSVSLNAVPALTLSTIPFNPSDEDALEYHFKLSDLYPPENSSNMFMNKTIAEDRVEIIFRSVTGRIATVVKALQEASSLTVGKVYKQVGCFDVYQASIYSELC